MPAWKPILFSAPMVRAIANGTKTQTRRIISKPTPTAFPAWFARGEYDAEFESIVMRDAAGVGHGTWSRRSPYGVPGDYLWVRENFRFGREYDDVSPASVPLNLAKVRYAADGPAPEWAGKGRPSIHMPQILSRIHLKITGVRVERLQDISEEDAKREGVELALPGTGASWWRDYEDRAGVDHYAGLLSSADESFASLWRSINGGGSWDANPWVWVIEFRVLTPGECGRDEFAALQKFASTTCLDSKQIANAMGVLQ